MSKFKFRRTLVVLSPIVLILLTAIAFVVSTAPPSSLPISIWDGNGQIVARYELKGHQAFHVRVNNPEYPPGSADLAEMTDLCIRLAGDRLEPDHGLYIIVEVAFPDSGESLLAFAVGMTHDAVQEWPGEKAATADFPSYLFEYTSSGVAMVQLGWPDWVDVETVVWGYAWLVAVGDMETHPWYKELIHSRPLPLDSAFMFEEK